MSRLKLYWPDAQIRSSVPFPGSAGYQGEIAGRIDAEPAVIPFNRFRQPLESSPAAAPLSRAHRIFANSRCPSCGYPVIQPLELNDAAVGRGNLPIPGTATLVGFRCDRCDNEWPA